jgi:hypothetical protein
MIDMRRPDTFVESFEEHLIFVASHFHQSTSLSLSPPFFFSHGSSCWLRGIGPNVFVSLEDYFPNPMIGGRLDISFSVPHM